MASSATEVAIATAVSLVTFSILYIQKRSRIAGRQLPPDPAGLPLIGNLLQVPTTHLASYFRQVTEEYGGLAFLNLAGSPTVLIGDMKVAKDLLDKHSIKHSSRPLNHMFSRHVDPHNDYWAFSQDSEAVTIGRRLTTGIMSAVRSGETEPLQDFEAKLNIQLLLEDGGDNWLELMERAAASVVLTALFGLHCPTGHEPELKLLREVLAELEELYMPSSSIVNFLPFLDWIPWEMPWRTRAKAFRKRQEVLYKTLIDNAVNGKGSGMNTYQTAVSLQTFVLACIMYPEWVAVAQKEIDAVVGSDRMPSFQDRPHLPYIEAIIRVRFGIPHFSVADDVIEYRGKEYFIPKGSTIFPVSWAIEHDQSAFEDHDRFMPERFLDSDGKLKLDYSTSAFGFGRRICPGIPFAERSLWADIVTMLWTFNIRGSARPDTTTGLPLRYDDRDAAFHGGVANVPKRFPAVFEPRSAHRVEVARRDWAECEKDLNVLLPAPKDR
ncbi:hypothetical protein H0H92_013140 [Tricholoma furcatifolium]|nr:hypothetical protein H0H92_013140 [Tricholoma furcatifolium]